jgi:glyoxylase-like metal-dependent hydrolase (beta-lactamase superfamily II)
VIGAKPEELELDPLSPAEVSDGIWRISLPTPWPVGPVNVYLIDDDPLTLLDTGPNGSISRAALDQAMMPLGRRVEEIERVIVSHQHFDHSGQAGSLVERSGAELWALDGLAEWLATFPASAQAETTLTASVLRRHGASQDALASVCQHNVESERYGAHAIATNRIADGDVIPFAARQLRVLHWPGHSPSDTLFLDEERGILLAGDVLLRNVRSTALISPPLDGSEVHVRPRAFAQYLQSLRSLRELELKLLLPGHGEPIHDHRTLVDERVRGYNATTEKVAGLLSKAPRTASEIALALRGDVPDPASYFVLCEVLGYLDQLLDAGIASEVDGPIKLFARA